MSPEPRPNLDAYFQRIGYVGNREPSLETLRELQRKHTAAIAFENLNPLLGLPVRLDVASLERKLVTDRRGGYCFEQNGLFSQVLRALGFELVGLAARVTWNQAEDASTARSHMLLRVTIDRRDYIADVGFGVMTLTEPIRLEVDVEQQTSHEPFRLAAHGTNELKLQAKLLGAWKTLYRFDLTPQLPIDYEVANYYISTHPASQFVQNLMAARTSAEHRYALINNELSIHRDGHTTRRVLANADELRAALEGEMQLRMPESAALMTLLTRLTAVSRLSD
jgi:N-hydroxyarylamine O-acetyltransferase